MTVAENLVLGAEPQQRAAARLQGGGRAARASSRERFGLAVDPDAKVEDLGVGAQQRVEILRALFRGAKVLVLDEPTAVLTAQEAQDLFEVLRALTAEGTSIVFISHKLNEVLDVADRVTVLRRGEKIDTVPTEGATERSLARLMVGRDVLLRVEKPEHKPGEPLLAGARASRARDDRGLPAVRDVVLRGARGRDRRPRRRRRQRPERADRGDHGPAQARRRARSRVAGQRRHRHAARARRSTPGVGHIAEDRHRRGLVLEFDLAENLCLREYREPGDRRAAASCRRSKMAARARGLLKEYDVRGGDAGHARRLAVGRQPAEGRDRARAVGRPEGADRRAADARAGRRRDRVRAPPAGRGARRGPRDPARLARAGGDPLARATACW